jgi:hypothetical protein
VRDKEGYYWIVDRRKELIKYKVGGIDSIVYFITDWICNFRIRASKVCLSEWSGRNQLMRFFLKISSTSWVGKRAIDAPWYRGCSCYWHRQPQRGYWITSVGYCFDSCSLSTAHFMTSHHLSGYVVHAHPERVKSQMEKDAFARHVKKWIRGRVAKHKFLRGGSSSTCRLESEC